MIETHEPEHYEAKVANMDTINQRKEDSILSHDADIEPRSSSLIQMKARALMREGMTRVEETDEDFAGFDASLDGLLTSSYFNNTFLDRCSSWINSKAFGSHYKCVFGNVWS